MQYKLEHPALEGEEVVLAISGIFGNPQLFHNGNLVMERSAGTNIYSIKKETGNVIVSLEPKKLDPFPRMEIEGKLYPIGRKLNPLDYLLVAMPMLLLLGGGLIGGVIGVLASSLNARIMRMPKSALERYGFSVASFIGASIIWFSISYGIGLLIGPAV